ncbi:hypothetical protein CKAN_02708000 [Cinnamomum micranthum f. kanehirae]|uniref:Uncharacterized protein n=1 Tax=Cinnamomum micranthum f. kanehirae TaxID=337451 RepID=A0A3S3RC42_9MAGN|nr:hypothetical protein CKAN_02708000 [Cinnamomum micranthum f. kanehirae]
MEKNRLRSILYSLPLPVFSFSSGKWKSYLALLINDFVTCKWKSLWNHSSYHPRTSLLGLYRPPKPDHWNINTLIFWYMAPKQDSRFDSEDLVIFKLQEMASECMRKGDEHGVGGGRLFGGKLFSLLLCRRKKKEGML